MRRLAVVALLAVASRLLLACTEGEGRRGGGVPELRGASGALRLADARRCDSGFAYPQPLVDGLSQQLIEELRCMDDSWLVFYTPSRERGGVWAEGPQPLAMRPEVLDALSRAAASNDDFITITAAYRDVAMQYYSRWYKENCDEAFNAALPGESNHQGGRAIDVKSYLYWWDTLLDFGFEHPIETDEPHFEFAGDESFRAESSRLQWLSVLAFQRLWNRNHPELPLIESGVYDDATRLALGESPVEGFEGGACPPGSEESSWDGVGPDVGDVAGDAPSSPDADDLGDETPQDAPDGDTRPADTGRVDGGGTDTGRVDAGGVDAGRAETGSTGADSTPAPPSTEQVAQTGGDGADRDDGSPSGGCSAVGSAQPVWPSLLAVAAVLRRRRRE